MLKENEKATRNELQIFDNPKFGEIRTLTIDGEPWLAGKDVAEILGYSNPQKAIRDHIDEDDKTVNESFTVNGTQAILINESGLYSLILSSKLPNAKQFKRWVTSEVLPAIRKTGTYSVPNKQDKSIEIKERNSRVRLSNQFLKLAKVDTLSTEYKNILVSKAAEALTGFALIPLPQSEQKMYSATEIGKMFGVSAQKIGRVSNEHDMKTEEYGGYYRTKSQHCCKEVDSFVYNDKAVERFREIFGK